MTRAGTSPRSAEFRKPDGALAAAVGGLFIAAACVGVVMAALMLRRPDLTTIILIVIGFAGACALGMAFINTWRRPMLAVRPDAITVPTIFGVRDIPVRTGQSVGEFLASSVHSGGRGGTIEDNKFVHFYLKDADGALVELVALHRAAPMLAQQRRAVGVMTGILDPVAAIGGADFRQFPAAVEARQAAEFAGRGGNDAGHRCLPLFRVGR